MSSRCVLIVAKGAVDAEQHVKPEPEWSAAAGKQSNTCKGSPRCPRWPGYQATRRESPHVGGGRETRAAGAPVVGGVQDTGQPEQRVLHGLPPPCWSKGVLFVGLLESSPVMNTSAYARSNPTSTTCTPISMVVVGCATPSLSTACHLRTFCSYIFFESQSPFDHHS